ncbi:TraB/GumN family protein [Perlabentimonas gracilis]|uniref:TraB/GumN family protein n=1 Tax=Perlabentimonas gracilis TaxID=2715279 RepID=UPI0014073499|nr:TraB/GumN family protein [Perlabentimonas gracilis]NHB68688.1 TraB/GumN family protein [Perlabentimonas gracilis]
MKKTLITTLFILLASICVFAQSLLYKVTGENMQYPVYIYGTIHALPQADFFIDSVVIEKFAEADKLVLEIDMSNPNMAFEVQSAMMMKDNSIDNILTPEEYARLSKFFADSLQMPIAMLNSVKPLMLSSFLLPKLIGTQVASYEGYFMQQAVAQQKQIGGLETVVEQISHLDMIPLPQQAQMLMESIDDFNKSRSEFKRLVETYQSRDVEAVYQVVMETEEEYKEFGEFLIDKRNENWIPKIIELGNAQTTFVAVGCGHLGGEKGVLNLLRNEGFEVKMME